MYKVTVFSGGRVIRVWENVSGIAYGMSDTILLLPEPSKPGETIDPYVTIKGTVVVEDMEEVCDEPSPASTEKRIDRCEILHDIPACPGCDKMDEEVELLTCAKLSLEFARHPDFGKPTLLIKRIRDFLIKRRNVGKQ